MQQVLQYWLMYKYYYFHLEDTSTLLDGQAEDVGAAANAFND